MTERYLHIGCGPNVLPKPFENLDIRELEGVDHISDVYPLTFEDNTFDLIYCSHVLEHIERDRTQLILNEWVRVLKPGGTLRISVPSFESLSKIYQKNGKLVSVIGPLMGGQTYVQNFHYNAFDTKSLTEYLNKAGLTAIHPWDYRRTSHADYWDFSQATTEEIPTSLNLEGRKKYITKDKIEASISIIEKEIKFLKQEKVSTTLLESIFLLKINSWEYIDE